MTPIRHVTDNRMCLVIFSVTTFLISTFFFSLDLDTVISNTYSCEAFQAEYSGFNQLHNSYKKRQQSSEKKNGLLEITNLNTYLIKRSKVVNYSQNKIISPSVCRRKALITAASTLTILAPTIAHAEGSRPPKLTSSNLEDINIGTGKWASVRDRTNLLLYMRNSIVPATFVTYATRFLIQYDDGVASWWQGTIKKYSQLSSSVKKKKLEQDFASLAISISEALVVYSDFGNNGSSDSDNRATSDFSIVPENSTRYRFENLADIFVNQYGEKDKDVIRHITLLFSMLPSPYQPIDFLKKFTSTSVDITDIYFREEKSSPPPTDFQSTGDLTNLLPLNYQCAYNTLKKSFCITPTVIFSEFEMKNNYDAHVISTIFGPLAFGPLKRELPVIPFNIYKLIGVAGAAGCSLTHSVVIPLDVVKTRVQTNPEKYKNIIDGTATIYKNEGISALFLGTQATIAGYLWYGVSVYPSYSFFKRSLALSVFTPSYATAHLDIIALIAGALAAVVASVGLTPLEACRIKSVSEPKKYVGLFSTIKKLSEEDKTLGWKTLYAGLPSLLTRQVLFGSVKFLAFERACEVMFASNPGLRDNTITVLGVTFLAGAFSGAISSVVSQPADSVLTYVAKNSKGSLGVISGGQLMIENEGVESLFRGLGSRCIWASFIISGQFLLYDIFRNLLHINGNDLSQTFQLSI